ncbi:MAG: hypothetical protein PHT13_15075 [Methanosarcina sp.]|nr:hypothetical protein [Methanosarcina sp.]
MESKIASSFNLSFEPVTVLWSDEKPDGALQFKPGKHSCNRDSFQVRDLQTVPGSRGRRGDNRHLLFRKCPPVLGACVVVQGFGAVGRQAARFFNQKGAVLVGVADSRGTVHDPNGLDVDVLIRLKKEGKSVLDYPGEEKLGIDAVLAVPCDIWIPAARPDVINESNVHLLNTKLVVEGANIPVTEGAEKSLYEKGILYVPDFIANAGGVICAASEYQGTTRCTAFGSIEEKVRSNVAQYWKL